MFGNAVSEAASECWRADTNGEGLTGHNFLRNELGNGGTFLRFVVQEFFVLLATMSTENNEIT
jgi:hypothetical protein